MSVAAINLADALDWATRAGTLPMQALLMLGLIALGFVVKHLHALQQTAQAAFHQENQKTQREWMEKIESERAAMSRERVDRINMLIGVLKEDTLTKANLVNAIENNTKTIERFEDLLTRLIGTKVVL